MVTKLNGHELPVNKQAAFSYAKGCHYKPQIPDNFKLYDVAPQTIPFPGPRKEDLTGRSISRLKVIGYAGYSKWVVRCVCGNYEIRNGKNLRKTLNGKRACNVLACFECMRFADKKRHYEFIKHGYNKHPNLDYYLR